MDPPPVQYVKTSDGYDIAYALSGRGGPQLLLGPAVFNHVQQVWSLPNNGRFLEELANRFRTLQFDHRGQGMSTRGLTRPPTSAEYQLDLEAVIERQNLQGFVWFALTSFARVAAQYIARHPERVKAFIAWNPSFENPMQLPAALATRRARAIEDWDYYLFTIAHGMPAEDPLLVKRVFDQCFTREDFFIAGDALAAFRASDIGSIQVPTLILGSRAGTRALDREADCKRVAAQIPGSQLVLFDESSGGMTAPLGKVPRVILEIERFLGGLDTSRRQPDPPFAELSLREVEVLRLLAEGKSNQQIADELVISINTAQRHLNHIYTKIGASNRVEAAAYAQRQRLI